MSPDPRAAPALATAPLLAPGALRIEPVAHTAVTLLRAPAESARRIAGMTGLNLPEGRRAVQGMGGAMAIRSDEDAWLFLTSADAEPALWARLEKAFADRRHQLVDLTDATPGVIASGPAARAMLAHATLVDAHAHALPAGTYTPATIAGADIRLIAEADQRLRLLMRRSDATHIWSALARAGREWGLVSG